jgi:hypothetical protein
MDDPMSEAGLGAYDKALELTFQEDLGPFGRKALEARSSAGWLGAAMRYIFPFITTPTNILIAGVRKSPAGSVSMLYKAMRQGLYTIRLTDNPDAVYRRREFARDAAEQVLAWSTFAALWAMTDPGDEEGGEELGSEQEPFITGTSASFGNRGKRELEYRAYPSMSIRIGDTWYSYARLEPLSTPLSIVVDALGEVRAAEAGKPTSEAISAAWRSIVDVVKEKTFLKGLGDIIRAVEYEGGVARWTSDFTTSWVPNIIRSAGRNADDNFRDYRARGEGRRYAAELLERTGQEAFPIEAWAPPARVDLWGRESVRYGQASEPPFTDYLWRITLPVWRQDADRATELDRLILNWNNQNPTDGFYPAVPEATFTFDGETIRMTAEEYNEFMRRAGQSAYDDLTAMGLDASEPTRDDIETIDRVLRDWRTWTKDDMIEEGRFSKIQQMMSEPVEGGGDEIPSGGASIPSGGDAIPSGGDAIPRRGDAIPRRRPIDVLER